jgi:hypothetical protein
MKREAGHTGGLPGWVPNTAELLLVVAELLRRAIASRVGLNLTPLQEYADAQLAAPQAATSAYVPTSGYIPAWWAASGEDALRRKEYRRYAADVNLNALALVLDPRSDLWEGDDWDSLQRLPRQLLRYMQGRQEAPLDDALCREVWGKDAADVSEPAVYGAVHKANDFLLKRQETRRLEKARDRNALRWSY